jgi:cell wall-associated NlpC family hydrolase
VNAALAAAAASLLDTPFRLHGRDPETGLDCVGLVAAALKRCGQAVDVPRGYTMRSADVRPLLHFAASNGLREVADNGDVILAAVHSLQPHLLIRVPAGFVHAHAGLGRVTLMPAPLPWPIARQWQLFQTED